MPNLRSVFTLNLFSFNVLAPMALLILAFLFRCLYLDKSLGLDEIYSAQIAHKDIYVLIHETYQDYHPPLYYLLLHIWIKVFNNEVWLRLLSVIFGTSLTFVAYILGKEAFGRNFGLATGLLTTFSSQSVTVSQIARSYVFQALLINLSLLWLIRAVRYYRAIDWIKHTAVTVLSIYTFYFSFLVVLLNNVTILLFYPQKRILRPWIWSQVVIFLCFSPSFFMFLHQVAAVNRVATIDRQVISLATGIKNLLYIALTHLPGIDYRLILPSQPLVKTVWPIVLLVMVLRFAIPFLRREYSMLGFCLVHTFGIFLLAFLLQSFNLIFVSVNYFTYIVPWLFMLISASVFEMGKKWRWAYAGIVIVLSLNLIGLVNHYSGRDEDYRSATAYIDRMADDSDLVCTVADFISMCYRFYTTRHLQAVGLPSEVPGFIPGMTMHDNKTSALLSSLFRGHKSVWMMYAHVARGPVDRGKNRAREVLFQNGFHIDPKISGQFGGVEVEVFRAK